MPQKKTRKRSPGDTARNMQRRKRANEALQLRASGWTYRQIAEEMRINVKTAYQYVDFALKEITRENAEQVFTLELERCDSLLAAIFPQALEGDLFAIDRALSIMARIERLHGVESPKAADQAQAGYDRLTQLLNAALQATPPTA